jgi:hypothetical protein
MRPRRTSRSRRARQARNRARARDAVRAKVGRRSPQAVRRLGGRDCRRRRDRHQPDRDRGYVVADRGEI